MAGTQPDERLLLFAIGTTPESGLEIRQQEQTARNNGWLSEWRPVFRAAEPFPISAFITGLSGLVLASENTRGRPLLCSVASGTGLDAEQTPLVQVGYLPHSDDELTRGLSYLHKPLQPFDPA